MLISAVLSLEPGLELENRNEAGFEARFGFNKIKSSCQTILNIKAIDIDNKKRGMYQKSMCMCKVKEALKLM